MNAINKVQLTGNLGNDPEIKNFENGKLAKFSMATKEEFTTRSGERSSDTQWHYIIAWGKVAERVENEFKKGSFVSIEGKLVTRNYTDKNGQKKYVTEVVANEVALNQKQS
ncbi:single-stranded DNA-binding protein [Aurantibacillus circumpalustris]|uniref:single-stranded DNA-binding protein n=1 Tax=Aurantibacillus circumpalustris TaxID=3036359 RepID=UPI00295A788F|nr:single-stranded DNA-binding protein [Aurantibacillus circumpalustris]